jgi:hypothetical protein
MQVNFAHYRSVKGHNVSSLPNNYHNVRGDCSCELAKLKPIDIPFLHDTEHMVNKCVLFECSYSCHNDYRTHHYHVHDEQYHHLGEKSSHMVNYKQQNNQVMF